MLEQLQTQEDPFKQLFDDQYQNLALISLYILGLVSCLGLCLVSWYEKSGQAGSYRTLVNQLVSMRLDQVSTNFCPKLRVRNSLHLL